MPKMNAEKVDETHVCTCCGYVYDPAEGDPEQGIPPGTAFSDLPASWTCPMCHALPEAFEQI
jgi:rubredoxin